MSSRVPPTKTLGRQNEERERQVRSVSDALRLDGAQFVRLYERMQELLANLSTTVSDLVASSTYTRVQVDEELAKKAPSAHGHTQDQVTGTWTKNVDTGSGGEVRTGNVRAQDVFAPGAVGYNITGTRRTVWIEDATGRLGYASSTETEKTNVRAAAIDVDAVLSITPVVFQYVAQWEERRRRAALPSPWQDWDPDYKVHQETGFIAEHLVDAGLGFCVIHGPDGSVQGIEYPLLVVAQQAVLRHLADEQRVLRADVDTILSRLETP